MATPRKKVSCFPSSPRTNRVRIVSSAAIASAVKTVYKNNEKFIRELKKY